MIINIVCSDRGWVYDKFIDMFKKYSSHTILRNAKDNFDIVHYIPYYELIKKPKCPATAWMSHQEAKNPLNQKFIQVAKQVDVPISHSKKYADLLMSYNSKTIQIIPGVDLEKYTLRSTKRSYNCSGKLCVGYVGRKYRSSTRKNPALIKEISNLINIEFMSTMGNLTEKQMIYFYHHPDLIISPATIEGGPMAIQEALACGTPIICFDGVGVSNEFKDGVIRVPYGQPRAFLDRIKKFWEGREYLYYRKPEVMRKMRKQVENQTWKHFVEKHDEVWSNL